MDKEQTNMNVIQLDEVDQDNILLENILIKPDTEEKLKQQTPLSVMDQVMSMKVIVMVLDIDTVYLSGYQEQ